MKSTIDLYKIGKVLGRGAYGKVSLALHRLTRKLVAIKSSKKEFMDDHDLKKLKNEIDILKFIRHESCIKLYETFETETHCCIV
jgi:5'-AMP-activated protein kinase, catalytic alpha subunit